MRKHSIPLLSDTEEYRRGCRQLAAWHNACALKRKREAARRDKVARRTFETEGGAE